MSLSSKYDLVLRLSNDQEKQAALMFKTAHDECIAAERDLEQAMQYRGEYLEISKGMVPSSLALIQLKAARLFLVQVDKLIEHQQKLLLSRRGVLEARREAWQAAHAKTSSIRALIESREKVRTNATEKLNQRLLDDLFLSKQGGELARELL